MALLQVDSAAHAAEIIRFDKFVVRGPGAGACWIWCGALADDGYGRFWLNRNGAHRVVRPNRYALALAQHLPLGDGDVAMHDVCDLPLCVRAEVIGGHIVLGTQSDNLARMGRTGRGGGRGHPRHWYGPDRAARATRSRALREAVRHGWDDEAVREALEASVHATLF